MQHEHSPTHSDALPMGYSTLQQILLQLGHPETRDRTFKPRTDLGLSDVVICVLSTHDRYLPLLLEGGRCCPGRMLLCLSPSWVSTSVSQANPNQFSLFVHHAVTFESGGYTYLDVFNPPCRVTYLLEDSAEERESLLVGLDCPSAGSTYLNKQAEDVLLTRCLLGERVGDVPPMLALCYFSPSGQTLTTPCLTVVSMKQAELQSVCGDIDTFLQLPELKSCNYVTIQLSSIGWGTLDNVSVLRRPDKEGILAAVQARLADIKPGESILLTACLLSIQPLQVPKVINKMCKAPSAAKASLSLRISASVCRAVNDLPQVTQVLCWVDREDAHPRAPHTGLRTLGETLTIWGATQSEVSAVKQLIEQRAITVMQAIMDHQSGISGAERGGAQAQTDTIGVEFSLSVHSDVLQPLFLGVKAHFRGVFTTPAVLLDPSELDKAMGPFLQIMCHRSHSFLMSRKTLLVLGAGGLKGLGIWHAAKTYGIKVICISHRPYKPVAQLVEYFLEYDYQEHTRDEAHADAIAEMLRQQGLTPDGCVTFTCSNTILVALLNTKLGLPGDVTEAVAIAKTKSRTQLHLAAVGQPSALLPGPSGYAARCEHVADLNSLLGAAGRVGFPAVMKLEQSAGSEAVVLVEDLQSCREYLSSRPPPCPSTVGGTAFIDEPLLMEYLDGPKYVVDVVMHQGKLLAAFLSDCGPSALPYFSNSTHVMPSSLCPESQAEMTMAAYQCCHHCGLHSGVYNLDMKLTSTGPKLVEINPRTGGNYLPSWIKAVYGFDMYLAAFLIGCGIQPALWTPVPRGFYVGASCPASQHAKAVDRNPSFDSILDALVVAGVVDVMQLEEHMDPKSAAATLNLSSFRSSKEEAASRVLTSFRVLGLSAGGYPVEQFLKPLL